MTGHMVQCDEDRGGGGGGGGGVSENVGWTADDVAEEEREEKEGEIGAKLETQWRGRPARKTLTRWWSQWSLVESDQRRNPYSCCNAC